MKQVEVVLPNHLGHGFDYAVPADMPAAPGDYVLVPFGKRHLPGVVWQEREHPKQGEFKVKDIAEHYDHLPPLSEPMQKFLEWVAWYTLSPLGAVMKMTLPISEALRTPTSRERSNLSIDVADPEPVTLSKTQRSAADALIEKLGHGYSATFLDGVTGSGKTEVYFEAIAEAIKQGKQALILLPEIALSVQWLERFRRRFGFAPVAWHSNLPPGLKKHSWRAIVQGEARVIVGARSALFLPYRDLGILVVDEEHDAAFKQEDGVIYHGRDMAVMRAYFEKLPIVLASATPSLETYSNTQSGKYTHLELPTRHAEAKMPELEMVDMRSAELERGYFIARKLRDALAETLGRGHQSLLFLNRRGYAPLVLCRTCGHRFQCPQCTAWLVLHGMGFRNQDSGFKKSNPNPQIPNPTLHCHHCDFRIPAPSECPECKAEDSLHACGPGVERLAAEVAEFLPDARLGVMTSDHTENYKSLTALIEQMQAGEIDILIGTQMVAKGHHFANLALVGVVDADLGLGGGDLRAAERTYQLLHQISGRAGRESVEGRVLLQSFAPDHPVMQALLSGQRTQFLEQELQNREFCRMPPFSRLAAIIVESNREDLALSTAKRLAATAPNTDKVQVLGPSPAPLYMLRGRYRQRLLVRAPREIDLSTLMRGWVGEGQRNAQVRVKVDIDPQSFL